jgi:hypothetical protein
MRPWGDIFRHPVVRARDAGAVLVSCLLLATSAFAQDSALELAVKATYLVKFAQFVEWPAGAFETPASPLNLCIVGQPLNGLADRAAAGQTMGQHPLAIRHIALAAPTTGCHILYTDGSAEPLDAVRQAPVLTVTDLPQGAVRRGIINFVVVANHLRFEIDDREAAAAGLHISSQLLALAVDSNAR